MVSFIGNSPGLSRVFYQSIIYQMTNDSGDHEKCSALPASRLGEISETRARIPLSAGHALRLRIPLKDLP
jgi:hypothetical protein